MGSARSWNHWYHCTGSTYGTWLPGDPRGWRTRNHRIHVEGDYRNPPADTPAHERLHTRSEDALGKPPVRFNEPAVRSLVCEAMAQSFHRDVIKLEVLAVAPTHFHALIRAYDDRPAMWIGRAKRCASLTAGKRCEMSGGVWARKCLCKPIADELHWQQAREFIEKHRDAEAAALWLDGHVLLKAP